MPGLLRCVALRCWVSAMPAYASQARWLYLVRGAGGSRRSDSAMVGTPSGCRLVRTKWSRGPPPKGRSRSSTQPRHSPRGPQSSISCSRPASRTSPPRMWPAPPPPLRASAGCRSSIRAEGRASAGGVPVSWSQLRLLRPGPPPDVVGVKDSGRSASCKRSPQCQLGRSSSQTTPSTSLVLRGLIDSATRRRECGGIEGPAPPAQNKSLGRLKCGLSRSDTLGPLQPVFSAV